MKLRRTVSCISSSVITFPHRPTSIRTEICRPTAARWIALRFYADGGREPYVNPVLLPERVALHFCKNCNAECITWVQLSVGYACVGELSSYNTLVCKCIHEYEVHCVSIVRYWPVWVAILTAVGKYTYRLRFICPAKPNSHYCSLGNYRFSSLAAQWFLQTSRQCFEKETSNHTEK